MTLRVMTTRGLAILIGAAIGMTAIFALEAIGSDDGRSPETQGLTDDERELERALGNDVHRGDGKKGSDAHIRTAGDILLAWTPGSLPPETEARVERLKEVAHATTVYAGLDWISRSRQPGGSVVDAPRGGFRIPFEIAAIEPREYAAFAPRGARSEIRDLERGELLLADTATRLRHGGKGLRIELTGGKFSVGGVVSDLAANGYEALMRAPVPTTWARADRFVLIRLKKARHRDEVEAFLRGLAGADAPLQTRTVGENPFLRYGDAVLPQLLVKDIFGEFAARPLGDGTIEINPRWVARNIRTEAVPLLGSLKCHRVIFPQLREALTEIKRRGLGHLIHRRQYSGCYSPRFINSNPNGRLSHHSWGMAIDINAQENPYGTRPNLDYRIVDVFEDRWGFTWGGHWIVPDGMHFEWVRFP